VKRAALAGLWIATIAATWAIVRETVVVHEPPIATAPDRVPSARSAPHLPAFRDPTVKPIDDAFFQTTMATLERDLADGRWGIADRDRLNAALRRATGEQTGQLLAVLFPKLNNGTIKSDIAGPPI
jgi:hypothetical protein